MYTSIENLSVTYTGTSILKWSYKKKACDLNYYKLNPQSKLIIWYLNLGNILLFSCDKFEAWMVAWKALGWNAQCLWT